MAAMKGARVFAERRASSWYIITRRNSFLVAFLERRAVPAEFSTENAVSRSIKILKTRASLEKTLQGRSSRRIPEGAAPMSMLDCKQPQNALTNLARRKTRIWQIRDVRTSRDSSLRVHDTHITHMGAVSDRE